MTDELPPTLPDEENAERPTRPASVTWFAFGVLSITVLGFLRAYLAISGWRFLASWPGVSPLYLTISGLLVGSLGGWLFWALARRKESALRLSEAVVLTLVLGYWLDQIFVAEHPYSDPAGAAKAFLPVNWPFAAGVSVIVLLYTKLMISSAKVKAYFGDKNE